MASSDDSGLFETARQLAQKKGLVISCPLVISIDCQISPLCKHCMWRTLKTVKGSSGTLSKEAAIQRAIDLESHGVNRVRVVSGWVGYSLPDNFYDIVQGVKENTRMEVFGSFGAINKKSIMRLKKAGVDGVVSGIETTNQSLFKDVRPGDNFVARIKTLKIAKQLGLKTSTAIIVGMGEKEKDTATAIDLVQKLKVDSLRILSFVPSPYTELEKYPVLSPYEVSKIVANARIKLKDTDITGLFGGSALFDFVWGIKSGANEFTVNRKVFSAEEASVPSCDESGWFNKLWFAYSGK